MDLVIMAAGMGSRFGGLKQVEPINEHGEFIVDYSLYDAIMAGFDRVIFVIRKENFELFNQTVGKRVEKKIEIKYVFQETSNLPIQISIGRKKPLGTGHAIFCIKDVVSNKFAVINSDDFYGADAFKVLYDFLKHNEDKMNFATVNYPIGQTLSDGVCKRGVCIVKNGEILEIIESTVEKYKDKIKATSLVDAKEFLIGFDNPVSVNMFGLDRCLFNYLIPRFEEFLMENKSNLKDCEFLLPAVLSEMMEQKRIRLTSLKTTAKWQGITYREDKERLVRYIKKQTLEGFYPSSLWN